MADTIGILSDTHLNGSNELFSRQVKHAFQSCAVIFHAGDITDLAVLQAFSGKTVYAVHGNMCSQLSKNMLPESRIVEIGGYSFALCHGAGNRLNIEERLHERFLGVDCIVYGHTHESTLTYRDTMLFVNPGSFISTGPYGSLGTYAIIEIDENGLNPHLYKLPLLT